MTSFKESLSIFEKTDFLGNNLINYMSVTEGPIRSDTELKKGNLERKVEVMVQL